MPLLLFVQIIVSIIFLGSVFTLRFFSAEKFNLAQEWYLKNINNSLLTEKSILSCKEILNSKLPDINESFTPLSIMISSLLSKPIDSGVVTSSFGKRLDPLSGEEKVHFGLDLSSQEGAPIYAILPGFVEKAETSPSFGNIIVLDHGNNIKTVYAHCRILDAKNGMQVNRGQKIAEMGNTGYYSTGTHLHIELIIDGQKYDPEPFFGDRFCSA